jgi:hypothetical protein
LSADNTLSIDGNTPITASSVSSSSSAIPASSCLRETGAVTAS